MLRKTRLSLPPFGVDVFAPPLDGLLLAEVEFDTDEAMHAFAAPPWSIVEVTRDPRFSGGSLATLERRGLAVLLKDSGMLPAMTEPTNKLAEQINGALKGFKAAYFYFWGELPVQPGDWVYQIDSASADGDRLDLRIVDGQGPKAGQNPTVLSVWNPEKVTVDKKKGLRIEKASKVKWRAVEATSGKGAALRIE